MNKKAILILIIVLALAGAGYYFIWLPQQIQYKPVAIAPDKFFGWKFPIVKFPITGTGDVAYSSIRDPGGIPQGLPVRLKIPAIGVDSAIEDALITPDGRMDVPSGSVDVAWFALGPHPGQVGSAVIGGHFGIQNGKKFVFYDLDKLVVGDKIYVLDDNANTITFQVKRIQLFDRNGDATTVFSSSDGIAHLNLITCEGVWNQINGSYPERRVVFTDLVPGGGVVEAPPVVSPTLSSQAIAIFIRPLSLGLKGADVAALQTILEQKGFLSLPSGATKGYFGTLTRHAVSDYQKKIGLPSIGIFGPMTRAKLIAELAVNSTFPTTGVGSVPAIPAVVQNAPRISVTSSYSFQTLVEYSKNLFATPVDAIVTIILLLSIVFIGYKIIRR